MYIVTIAKRKFRLLYDMAAYMTIERQTWPVPEGSAPDAPMTGFDAMLNAWESPDTKVATTIRLLCILANNALDAEGKEPDPLLNPDELMCGHTLRPGEMPLLNVAVSLAFKQGNQRQLLDEDDDDHDVVLEANLAKKEAGEESQAAGSSPTA